jgi:Ser/Thr protein kinase RdoA (MazF antagonist)
LAEGAEAVAVTTETWRNWRWVTVEADRVVFRATDDAGWLRLEREAEVIERFRRAGACVPAVHSRARPVQTRELIAGLSGEGVERLVFGTSELAGVERYRDDCPLTSAGARLAAELGRALAVMHGAIHVSDARKLGVERFAPVLSAGPLRLVERAMAWLAVRAPEEVVVHGDPHLHNMAVDEQTGALRGLFDFDELAVADRAWDLRYLHSNGLPFARAALKAYSEAGQPIDEAVVARFHVIAALDHFNFVAPTAERFPAIERWATEAAHALTPYWVG